MEQQDTIKYSVIVPVYNRADMLARCLDSLLRPNRQDIQIVVVNDGSRDDSGKIALEYAEKHRCIQYICQENRGVSAARNAGLSAAKGQYITFVDSDDFVMPNYYDVLDREPECDLLVFAHSDSNWSNANDARFLKSLQNKGDEKLMMLLASRKIMPPWNKRFRRDIIEAQKLRFIEEMHIGEDFNFCMAYAMHCGSIGIAADAAMCVDVSDPDSLSRKYRPQLAQKMDEVFRNAAQTIRMHGQAAVDRERLMAILDYLYVKNVFSSVAEEFKVSAFPYMRHRSEVRDICNVFRNPLASERCGLVHIGLRWMLKRHMDWVIWLVSWAVKGRKYRYSR